MSHAYYKRNKKNFFLEHVELYKQLGIFKNTRVVRKSTSRGRILFALLECSEKIPKCLDNSTMLEEKVFYFVYKRYRELRALVPMT